MRHVSRCQPARNPTLRTRTPHAAPEAYQQQRVLLAVDCDVAASDSSSTNPPHTHTPLYVPLTHLSWYTTFYSHTTLTSYITHTLSVSRARALPHSPSAALLLSLSRSRRLQLIFKTNCNCTQYISVRAYVCVWLYIEQHPFIRDCVYM